MLNPLIRSRAIVFESQLCYDFNMNEKYYTGIGSRKTPQDILEMMMSLARVLDSQGWTLRSGGADGADDYFQKGTSDYSNIFLPWKNFNNHQGVVITDKSIIADAMYLIQQHNLHEQWESMINNPKQAGALKMHIRNVFQVLGEDLKTPSKMLVCWTPDGALGHNDSSKITGGTRTAIRLADTYGVPVFNVKRPEHRKRIEDFIFAYDKPKQKVKSNIRP